MLNIYVNGTIQAISSEITELTREQICEMAGEAPDCFFVKWFDIKDRTCLRQLIGNTICGVMEPGDKIKLEDAMYFFVSTYRKI